MPLYRFHIETPWGQDHTEDVYIDEADPDAEVLDEILDIVYANNFPASIEQIDDEDADE